MDDFFFISSKKIEYAFLPFFSRYISRDIAKFIFILFNHWLQYCYCYRRKATSMKTFIYHWFEVESLFISIFLFYFILLFSFCWFPKSKMTINKILTFFPYSKPIYKIIEVSKWKPTQINCFTITWFCFSNGSFCVINFHLGGNGFRR